MDFGFVEVPAIAMICYLIGMACKAFDKLPDKFIPIIVGVSGGILGVIGFLTGMPDFPASDMLDAIAVGIASGLAATGVHQIVKQLNKSDLPEITEEVSDAE